MSDGSRIAFVLAAAALALWGLSLAADSQEERFLGDEDGQEFGAQPGASGNLVPVTAFLVATAAAMGVLALSRLPVRGRLLAAAEVAAGVWLLTVLVQSAFPNYDYVKETRFARLSVSGILLEEDGAALVAMPVFALLAAGLLAVGDGARRALARPRSDTLWALFGAHVGRVLLLLPFLCALAVGALRLLASVPVQEPGNGLALVVLPVLAIAATALVVLVLMRTWSLAEATVEPRLVPVARESWRLLGRIEAIVVGLLMVTALSGTLLPRTDMDVLALGRVLRFTLRSAVQGAAFVGVPLVALWSNDRRVWKRLHGTSGGVRAPLAKAHAVAVLVVTAVAALLALLTALASSSALLPWIVPLVVLALLAGILAPRAEAAPVQLLAAAAMWFAGNTVSAQHDPSTLRLLDFDVNPGVLILWRIAGAGLAAWALTRLVLAAADGVRRSLAIPLSLLAGMAMALIGWLLLAFTAWVVPGTVQDSIAVGSVLRSVPTTVRTALHVFDALLALGAALAVTRLVRPDWFRRPPATVAVPAAAPA